MSKRTSQLLAVRSGWSTRFYVGEGREPYIRILQHAGVEYQIVYLRSLKRQDSGREDLHDQLLSDLTEEQ